MDKKGGTRMINEAILGILALNTIAIGWIALRIKRIDFEVGCMHDNSHNAMDFINRMMLDLQHEEEAIEAVYGEWKDWDSKEESE